MVSFDATRAVWNARRAGELRGGNAGYVALALADRTDKMTGLTRGSSLRRLSADTGLALGTVVAALEMLRSDGSVEIVQSACGTRAAVYRLVCYQPNTSGRNGEPVDNNGQRINSRTLEKSLRADLDGLRAAGDTLAYQQPNNSSSSYLVPGRKLSPDDLRARVQELRNGLKGS